jgi:lysophospholipase L1-like esterase
VWVLALGTNDAPSPHNLRQHVRRSLRMAGPHRHVVWLTIKRPGGYHRVNRVLRAMDARYETLHVVDWARAVSRQPGLISGDRVHGTARGYEVRARLIADKTLALTRKG